MSRDLDFRDFPQPHQYRKPPFSLVYIECPRHVSATKVYDSFEKFGKVEFATILRDRRSGKPAGVAYVKYNLASTAALAVESMDNLPILPGTKPIRVSFSKSFHRGCENELRKIWLESFCTKI